MTSGLPLGPSWLGDCLAVAMLLVAAYCAGRVVVARLRRRTTSYSVDVFHVAMGAAMAGMLAPRLGLAHSGAWVVGFAVAAGWFALRAVGGLTGRRRAPVTARGHLAHVGTSGAMIYMLMASPAAASTGSPAVTSAMGDMRISSGGAVPVLGVLLVVFLAAYSGSLVERLTLSTATVSRIGGAVLAPRTVTCCQIAMNATMAYMVLLLL